MKQLEIIIDKDEYDRSNFEEKILKREELLSELNQENNRTLRVLPPTALWCGHNLQARRTRAFVKVAIGIWTIRI